MYALDLEIELKMYWIYKHVNQNQLLFCIFHFDF